MHSYASLREACPFLNGDGGGTDGCGTEVEGIGKEGGETGVGMKNKWKVFNKKQTSQQKEIVITVKKKS